MSCSAEIFNLRGQVLAAAFTQAAPNLQLIATIDDLPIEYWIVGMTLASSLLNYSVTQELGVFVVLGTKSPTTSFSQRLQSPVYHVTLQNSLTGPPVVPIPTNKTTPKPFRQPILLPPRTAISLYGFGDTTAGNQINAYLEVELVPKQK